MEKKNTILLTVIAVATLLVAVVGATFAYFTASNQTTGAGGTAEGQTAADLGSTSITMSTDGVTGASNMTYPGGMMVAAAKVEGAVEGNQTYDMSYTVNVEIDTTALGESTSEIKYTLYRVDDTAVSGDIISGCTYHEENGDSGVKKYYYTGCAANSSITSGADVIATQTIATHNGEATTNSVVQTMEDVTSTGKRAYYYLVVEYVNDEAADQGKTDAGKTITAKIASISNGSATLVSNGQSN